MNALQLKDGKFWLVLDVPEKPNPETAIFIADKQEKYKKHLKQALSNSIEVAKECTRLASELLDDVEITIGQSIKEGELYHIEGLTYELDKEGKAILTTA